MITLTALLEIPNQATIDINYRVLNDLSIKLKDRADNELPSYGIISTTGSVSFKDYKGVIKGYAERQLLQGSIVKINMSNTLTGDVEQIGEYSVADWDYDNASQMVRIELQDNLVEMQEINHIGIDLARDDRGLIISTKTAEDLYNELYNATPQKYRFLPFGSLDSATKARLQQTKFKYFYLESASLWRQWTKLCELVQGHIHKNSLAETIFKVD